jgi:hypothetical protein
MGQIAKECLRYSPSFTFREVFPLVSQCNLHRRGIGIAGQAPLRSDHLVFESRDLLQPAAMPLDLTEAGAQESLHKVPRRERANDPAAHANYVHVIVFHSLAGGVVVVD